MNAEQRGGMALNKDFRSKTGNGSVSREGRAIATPTGESCTHIPPSLLHLSLFISSWLFYFPSPWVKSACSAPHRCSVLCLCLSLCSQPAQTFQWFQWFALNFLGRRISESIGDIRINSTANRRWTPLLYLSCVCVTERTWAWLTVPSFVTPTTRGKLHVWTPTLHIWPGAHKAIISTYHLIFRGVLGLNSHARSQTHAYKRKNWLLLLSGNTIQPVEALN